MTISNLRVRTHEGSGLMIRIPRQSTGDKGPIQGSPHHNGYVSPKTSSANNPSSKAPVAKSKSLTLSMDKLSVNSPIKKLNSGGNSVGSSRDSSRPSSRGSSGSGQVFGKNRPPSRRSAPLTKTDRTTPDKDDLGQGKTDSPCGSEISLNSVASSKSSGKSQVSEKSSASGRSSTSDRSNKSRGSNSNPASRSQTPASRAQTPASRAQTPASGGRRTPITRTPLSKARSPGIGSTNSVNSSKSAQSNKSANSNISTSSNQSGVSSTPSSTPKKSLTSTPARPRSTFSNASTSPGLKMAEHRNNSRESTPSKQSNNRGGICGSHGGGLNRHNGSRKGLPLFNSYMSLFQVQEKLKKGEVIEGVLRINPKNYEDAYISAPEGATDIYIGGVPNRAAALQGDIVAIAINDPQQWKVLYDQLDIYLDQNNVEKQLVYSSQDSIISPNHSYNTASPFNPSLYNPINNPVVASVTVKDGQSLTKCCRLSPSECDCDVIVEEPNQASIDLSEKKKKRRRRKKKDETDDSEVSIQEPQADKYYEGDQLYLMPSVKKMLVNNGRNDNPIEEETTGWGDLPEPTSGWCEDLSKEFVVKLEDLSECDVSDNESGNSDIMDLDEVKEDRAFTRSQIYGVKSKSKINKTIKKSVLMLKDSSSVDKDCDDDSGGNLMNEMVSYNPVNNPPQIAGCLIDNNIEINLPSETKEIKILNENINSLSLDDDDDESIETKNNYVQSKKNKRGKVCDQIVNSISHPDIKPKHYKNKSPKINNSQAAHNFSQKNNISKSMKRIGNRVNQLNSSDNCRTEPNVEQVLRLPNWRKFIQRTAYVVHILERKHTRMAAGTLKLFPNPNPNFALFSPNDSRIPRMKIAMYQCPPDFVVRNKDYSNRIFLAKIAQWIEPKFASGDLVRDIGGVGDIEAETEALLMEYGIDNEDFPPNVLKELPSKLPWTISQEEINKRTDMRDSCIFTIDPATARDLDDAVSCLPLPSGNYRVGVHIADVTHFINENSSLDNMAACRATSVYLTQKVIPMLPRLLCESLCSLNPSEDRLAFSVVWELTPKGQIVGEWFGKTVIRSCAKLSYEHAQSMIESPEKQWEEGELPEITGGYSLKKIVETVNNLQKIAVNLRKRRFKEGALRLDQVKLSFNLDYETKMPNGFYVHDSKDSNKLIEEYMLLANMAVAHKIQKSFPTLAILRRHPPPLDGPMDNVRQLLSTLGITIDPSTSGTLNDTIQKYVGDDKYTQSRMQLIVSMCSKPMQFARYFCTGSLEDVSLFQHYALNVPLYTHFTSPIRRYADVMVHRLLAAALVPDQFALLNTDIVAAQRKSDHCNEKKQTAKMASEVSNEMYLGLFVKQVGELVEEAMVIGVLDKSFDVLVLKLGVIKRVYTDKIPVNITYLKTESKLDLYWHADKEKSLPTLTQTITFFTVVTVSLRPFENGALKFNAILLRPKD